MKMLKTATLLGLLIVGHELPEDRHQALPTTTTRTR
jgi:hypothetical protein